MADKYVVHVAADEGGVGDAGKKLEALLPLDAAKVERLLRRLPGVVTKPVPEATALAVTGRMRQAGLHATMLTAGEAVSPALTAPPSKVAARPRPAPGPAQAEVEGRPASAEAAAPPARAMAPATASAAAAEVGTGAFAAVAAGPASARELGDAFEGASQDSGRLGAAEAAGAAAPAAALAPRGRPKVTTLLVLLALLAVLIALLMLR